MQAMVPVYFLKGKVLLISKHKKKKVLIYCIWLLCFIITLDEQLALRCTQALILNSFVHAVLARMEPSSISRLHLIWIPQVLILLHTTFTGKLSQAFYWLFKLSSVVQFSCRQVYLWRTFRNFEIDGLGLCFPSLAEKGLRN